MKVSDTTVQVSLVAASLLLSGVSATAQEASEADKSAPQEVVVTGSRIYQTEAQREQPLSTISTEAIEKTGLADVGSLLQQLTTGGQALNTKFNSSGNFGYPPDGGGIGAGSAQVSLRNLDSKRVLVLVDGIRWVNESSASGVSGSADLNTIPVAMIDHIEVLEDGASSIYGSDAIAGVVNIITKKKFEGVEVERLHRRLRQGRPDDRRQRHHRRHLRQVLRHDDRRVLQAERDQLGRLVAVAYPGALRGPGGGQLGDAPGPLYVLRSDPADHRRSAAAMPQQDNWYDMTLNNGTTTPVWNPNDPSAGTYHGFEQRRPLQLRALQPAAHAADAQVDLHQHDLHGERLRRGVRQGDVQHSRFGEPGGARADLRRSVRRHRRPGRHDLDLRRTILTTRSESTSTPPATSAG